MTILDPDDFHGVIGTLSFTRNITESCVIISVVDDSVRESVPECFTVSLVNITGADLKHPSTANVCIEDNDGIISCIVLIILSSLSLVS